MLKGAVPNVDFLHLYGPGALQVLAGIYSVFGVRLEVERTVGLVQHLSIILAIYVAGPDLGRAVATTCAVAAVFLVLTPINLIALAWNGGVGLGLWSIICALRAGAPGTEHRAALVRRRRPAGRTARSPTGPTSCSPWPWLTASCCGGAEPGDARAPPCGLAGLAVGLVPYYVHLAMAGFGPSFRGMVIDPVFKLRPGRQLPRPPSWGHLDGALQAIAEKFPPWWKLPHLVAPRNRSSSGSSWCRWSRSSCSVSPSSATAAGPTPTAGCSSRPRCSAPGCSPRPSSGRTPPTSRG